MRELVPSGRKFSIDEVAAVLARDIEAGFRSTSDHVDIVVTGGAALGKTTLARRLAADVKKAFGSDEVVSLVNLDSFMYDREARDGLGVSGYSMKAYARPEMATVVRKLCSGEKVRIASYSHMTGRHEGANSIGGGRIVIYEGATAFQLELCGGTRISIMLFATTPSAMLLRLIDEIFVRSYSLARVLRLVFPETRQYRRYMLPNVDHADIVLRVTMNRQYRVARYDARFK